MTTAGDLLLSSGPLEIRCQVTVERLRGIAEPTWYGYFVPAGGVRVLPGRYRLRLAGSVFHILVRRPMPVGPALCFPFWGLGLPPAAAERSPVSAGDEDAGWDA